jgi:hypothetical protein
MDAYVNLNSVANQWQLGIYSFDHLLKIFRALFATSMAEQK